MLGTGQRPDQASPLRLASQSPHDPPPALNMIAAHSAGKLPSRRASRLEFYVNHPAQRTAPRPADQLRLPSPPPPSATSALPSAPALSGAVDADAFSNPSHWAALVCLWQMASPPAAPAPANARPPAPGLAAGRTRAGAVGLPSMPRSAVTGPAAVPAEPTRRPTTTPSRPAAPIDSTVAMRSLTPWRLPQDAVRQPALPEWQPLGDGPGSCPGQGDRIQHAPLRYRPR